MSISKYGQVFNAVWPAYRANPTTDSGATCGGVLGAVLIATLTVMSGGSSDAVIGLTALGFTAGMQIGGLAKHLWDERQAKKRMLIHERMLMWMAENKVEIPEAPIDASTLPPIDDNSKCVAWTGGDNKQRGCTKSYTLLGNLRILGAVSVILADGRVWHKGV